MTLRAVSAGLLIVGVFGAADPVSAQVVHGVVMQAGTNRPMPEVAVSLRNQEGRFVVNTISDEKGTFWLQAPRVGSYEIVAQRLGFTTATSAPVNLQLSQQIEVTLTMDVTAVQLDPVTVKARSHYDLGFLTGFYERMERNEKTGTGRFITRDQIDQRGPLDAAGLFAEIPRISVYSDRQRLSYVTMRGGPSGECHPRVYLNGALANRNERAHIDELVRPSDLEGVEIYDGVSQLPGPYHDEYGCGVILLWTRRTGDGPGRPFSWLRVGLTTALIGLLFLVTK